MGLLDDAIREHLDLKRRRGADPAEVERLEREALGPVRRNTGQTALEDAEPELTAGSAYDEPDNPIAADEVEVEAAYTAGGGLEPQIEPWDLDDDRTRVVSPRPDEPAPPAGQADEDDVDDEFVRHPPAAMADPESGAPPPLTFIGADDDDAPFDDQAPEPADHHGETTEYDVERALAEEEARLRPATPGEDDEGEDEDVLEETPEFLQDTPEHDRLWFEQRPPRDFDFDG
jgi:hypothetical protein